MELKARRALYRAKFTALRFLAIELPAALQRKATHHEPTMHRHQSRRDPVQVLGNEGEQPSPLQRPPEG